MKTIAKLYRALPMGVKTTLARLKIFKIYTWLLKRKKIRFVKVIIDGLTYNLDLYTYVGSSLYNFGVYEKHTTDIIKSLKEGMVAIDIGASIGAHTLTMAKAVGPSGRVYAFEPSENLFPILATNILENKLLNVTPEKIALSSKVGRILVDMTLLGNLDGSTPKEVRKRTDSTTIDSYIKTKELSRLDFIKIDTDGHEVKIIKGALETIKTFQPMMVIEFRQETAKPLVRLLKKIGYSFCNEEQPHNAYNEEELKAIRKVENVLCIYKQR